MSAGVPRRPSGTIRATTSTPGKSPSASAWRDMGVSTRLGVMASRSGERPPARARRPHADVRRALEQALERDPHLDAGQRAPGAGVDPASERDVLAPVRPVEPELVRRLEALRIAFAACGKIATVVPAGTATPAIDVETRVRRDTVFTGPSSRSTSSRKLGMRLGSARSCAWRSGRSAMMCNAAVMSRAVVSCPAANKNVAVRTTTATSGVEPSGYVAVRPVA